MSPITIDSCFKYKLLLGDAKDVLKNIPDNTFHCSITSPPYWCQRDYKVEGQLGQEDTPEKYVENLTLICQEVKRVLRNDGTFWLNIGDGYCKKNIKKSHLKQSDLIGIPWMVAFALRKDGWFLRSDIIWYKKNPMPESVTNRPSKAYEHLFLFSKSKEYFYDSDVIKEPQKHISIKRAFSKNNVAERKDFLDNNYAISGESQNKSYEKMRKKIANGEEMLRNKRDVWEVATSNSGLQHFAIFPEALITPCVKAGSSGGGCCSQCKSPWEKTSNGDWKQGCSCKDINKQECVVLDPFNGSGTTGRVCKLLHRKYVGIDINQQYLDDAIKSFIEKEEIICKEVDSVRDIIE